MLINRLDEIRKKTKNKTPAALVASMLQSLEGVSIAAVSSFGADSVVLLHMISIANRNTPIIFLDTEKHFSQTLNYRNHLIEKLGFTNVHSIKPNPTDIKNQDPNGTLWKSNPDACCFIRKTYPLSLALAKFDGWITGRRRTQSQTRKNLNIFEIKNKKLKINPIVNWTQADVENYILKHKLPRHPLVENGYLSIGCMVCTDRVSVSNGENPRSGRWRGLKKTECGIHQ